MVRSQDRNSGMEAVQDHSRTSVWSVVLGICVLAVHLAACLALLMPNPALAAIPGQQGLQISDARWQDALPDSMLVCVRGQGPASTARQTRGVHTPAIRPNEYRQQLNSSRGREQKVQRSLQSPRQSPGLNRSIHPDRHGRPSLSSDRMPR